MPSAPVRNEEWSVPYLMNVKNCRTSETEDDAIAQRTSKQKYLSTEQYTTSRATEYDIQPMKEMRVERRSEDQRVVGESKEGFQKSTKSKLILTESFGCPVYLEGVVSKTRFTEEEECNDIHQLFDKKVGHVGEADRVALQTFNSIARPI